MMTMNFHFKAIEFAKWLKDQQEHEDFDLYWSGTEWVKIEEMYLIFLRQTLTKKAISVTKPIIKIMAIFGLISIILYLIYYIGVLHENWLPYIMVGALIRFLIIGRL